MITKQCKHCKQTKELNEFPKRKENKDGHRNICSKCCYLRSKELMSDDRRSKRRLAVKKHAANNKEKIKEKRRIYYEINKEKEKIKTKEWRDNNKERIREYEKDYRRENREKMRQRQRIYERTYEQNRKKNDSLYRLKKTIRSLFHSAIKRNGFSKKSKTNEILGCSFEEFKTHIESLWEPWMNWGNYGLYEKDKYNVGWDLDHVVPSSSAMDEEGVMALNHYTNLQPLCSKVNRDIKRNNISIS